MACGIAGLSVAADSLSAIRYAQVKPIRDENGLAIDFAIEGEYPQYGNNDERVDSIACDLVKRFMQKISVLPTYRNAVPTPVHFDHHLERRVRAEDRQYAGWTPRRNAVRAGGEPDAWS
ncbi:formate acetyltransferase [Salmonella enterica subsp. enterica serovar Daytona]|uniref:Formate acetyltransferase n=1 Tax=Salmonella enterica subsp. enterica serovar Daytona TaxID=1962639 RepID=A0A447JC03_SALET|nr:formate acetyltransferase [Salmonella enterica subsp. enterica serovar Daytona]